MGMLRLISEGLPERYYLGVDIGYKEHVACVIALSTFAQGAYSGENDHRIRPMPITQTGGCRSRFGDAG